MKWNLFQNSIYHFCESTTVTGCDQAVSKSSSPFKCGPAGGLLDHEENPPALEGPCCPPTGHFFPPWPSRVKGRLGACWDFNFIWFFCKPRAIFNTVQHIVWSHNPLPWLKQKQHQSVTIDSCKKINAGLNTFLTIRTLLWITCSTGC